MKNDKLKNLLTSEYQNYDLIGNIPCLYSDKESALSEWSLKINAYIKEEETHLKHLQHRTNLAESKLTRKRLNDQLQARTYNLKQIKKILGDFFVNKEDQTILSSQQIHSYFDNIFRDWVWGEEELNAHIDILSKSDLSKKTILVLGAGAGGLSYLLAKKYPDSFFVDIEHNPLLAKVNFELTSGNSLKLSEYSTFPKSLDNTSKKHELKAEKIANKETVLATFPDLPFKEKSFDVVIAPWFLDILDMPFENALFCAREFLKEEGSFLFCGPSNVHKKQATGQICIDEMEELFNLYFHEVESEAKFIPYLASPLASQRRIENVSFINASRVTSHVPDVKLLNQLIDLSFTAEFEQYKTMTIVKGQILSHINSDITVEGLAEILKEKFNLSPEEALPYAEKFINKIKFEF